MARVISPSPTTAARPSFPGWASFLSRAALAILLGVGCVEAHADTATRFVERLRNAGHEDLVLEYLDRAADNPLVSEEFKERIPFERVATQLSLAKSIRRPAERLEVLEESLPTLRRLAEAEPAAARLLTDVLDQVGTAAADVGHRSAITADRLLNEGDREDALKAARGEIKSARGQLEEAEQRIVAEREGLKGVKPDSQRGIRKRDLGIRLGAVRLLRARLLHDLAETYPDNSGKRKQLNTDAAKQLGELYEKYSKLGIGLYAHLYEGRCYRLLGEEALALAALEDLTAQPAGNAAIRQIVTLAHAERAALLRDTGKLDEALEKPAAWLEGLSRDEAEGPQAATLRYHVALAAIEQAKQAKDNDKRRLQKQARDWLNESRRIPSEVQADARDRWAEVTASLGIEVQEPKNFAEAFQAGSEAIQAMLAADLALKSATGAEAERLTDQRQQSRDAAYSALEAASGLADAKTDPEQASRARYQLAWLDWQRGDIGQAATRAELIARHSSDTAAGEEAAELALAALERLQRDGDNGAGEKLSGLASFITKQWPSSDVARAASAVMVSAALRSGDFDAAEAVLATVAAEQRPQLALRLAVARWEKSKSDPSLRPAALERMRTAFDRASPAEDAGPFTVTAALYLAEAALDDGDAKQAAKLLNHPDYGPATRAQAGTAPADNPIFALTAYKAALRVAAATAGDAGKTVQRIKKLLAETPADTTGGDRAWLGVAVALLADLERSSSPASVAKALSEVLAELAPVEAAGDWNTRLWIAQARLRCGEVLEDKTAAKANVEAGRDAFVALIERAEREPSFAPNKTSILAARLRLAECQRELGEHADAFATLTKMLGSGGALLDVQRVAAETLQEWGVASKSTEKLEQAIGGTQPGADGKNVVWGWSKLAKVAGRYAATSPKQKELYFEAWRRVAASRYQAALLANGADRQKQLGKAAATLLAVKRQNPGLGGEASQRSFDELLKQIKSAQGAK